jgi:uncharacterized protein (TIGR02246 family)
MHARMTATVSASVKRFIVALVCSLSAHVAWASPVKLSGDANGAGEVWATFQSWVKAYDAGDVARIMDIFDKGVVFSFQGNRDESYDDLRRDYEADMKTRKPGTSWVPQVEEVYAEGKLAFVRSIWELRVSSEPAQSQVKARNRSMDVLRKDDGKWHIIRSINYPEKN